MRLHTLLSFGFATFTDAMLRFQCSQLVRDRVDPLVHPGMAPTTHIHQIVGGNGFNVTMDIKGNFVDKATCTTCQFSEDFSNYWTAIMYFRARNGTYKRILQRSNLGFDGARDGGMTVYYARGPRHDYEQKAKVTAFPPGFRMIVGNPRASTAKEAAEHTGVGHICLENTRTREPLGKGFPKTPCKEGIMTQVFFPNCWDGKSTDSPDHFSHMSYPIKTKDIRTADMLSPCPASHPVKVPQVMLETVWDTRPFNDKSLWPEDGSQPFVWSYGDRLGYGNHGDYVFGWKGDSLQKIMDVPCFVNCPGAKQSISKMNECSQQPAVKEEIDGWLPSIPGGVK